MKSEEAAKESLAEKPAQPAVETMPEGCTRELYTVCSPSMKREIRVAAVLPPDYVKSPDTRYPVLYALHGMGASYKTFSDMSPLRKFMVDHPMILIGFDGDRASCYVDSTEKPESQFTTFFFDELMPDTDRRYRTDGRVGATGFSMGGYGAMHYLLTRPEAFTAISSMSGAFDLFAPPAEGRPARRSELLGGYEENKGAYETCAVYGRLEGFVDRGVKLPPMLLTCGTEDHLRAGNRRFVDFLVAQNAQIRKKMAPQLDPIEDAIARRTKYQELKAAMMIDFTYVETPGGHDWPYWRGTSEEIARFHWRHFQSVR